VDRRHVILADGRPQETFGDEQPVGPHIACKGEGKAVPSDASQSIANMGVSANHTEQDQKQAQTDQ
jgi:hypothetical protein